MKTIKIGGWSFTQLNKDTKKAQQLISNYCNSYDYELGQVYGNYSRSKEETYNNIKKLCSNIGAVYPRITTFSKFVYTCGTTCEIDGKEYLLYFTHVNNFAICLN